MAPLALRQVALLRGRVVTGEALDCQRTLCQRTLCQQIRPAHRHYLFRSTAKQPELVGEVARLFDAPPPGERFATAVSRRARRDRGEARTLTSSVALAS